jgi:hypothetical protein
MFGFFTRSRRQPAPAPSRRVRLCLESLETRYCPAGGTNPVITLTATLLPAHTVNLSGTVADSNPASVRITFSGAVSASTMSDACGHYSFTTTSASLGGVSAQGIDGKSRLSNTACAVISDAPPNLTLDLGYGQQRTVTLSGKASDIDTGLTVTFSGQVTGSTTTASDGTFSYTASAAGLGTVSAQVTDSWGLSSTAQVTVTSAGPTITNFTGSEGFGGAWYFSGQVNDASGANGLVVAFGGVSELQGQQATTSSNGSFYITAKLSEQYATVTAQVTDCWGLSNTASFSF